MNPEVAHRLYKILIGDEVAVVSSSESITVDLTMFKGVPDFGWPEIEWPENPRTRRIFNWRFHA